MTLELSGDDMKNRIFVSVFFCCLFLFFGIIRVSGEIKPEVIYCYSDTIDAVAIDPDENYIISAGYDQMVRVWDLHTGKLLNTLNGHSDIVRSIAVDPLGNYIISVSDDHTIKKWELRSGKLLDTMKGHALPVVSVAISPTGKLNATS